MAIQYATFSGRKICVIEGYIFYLSSGKNSGKAGFTNTWVPLRNIEEGKLGSFVKPYTPNRRVSTFEMITMIMGSEFADLFKEKMGDDGGELDIPDESMQEIFCRLGNIEAACISLTIGTGFWKMCGGINAFEQTYNSSTAEIIINCLKELKYTSLLKTSYEFKDSNRNFLSAKEVMDWLINSQGAEYYAESFPDSTDLETINQKKHMPKKKIGFINTQRGAFCAQDDIRQAGDASSLFKISPSSLEECDTPTFPGLNESWYKNKNSKNFAKQKLTTQSQAICKECNGSGKVLKTPTWIIIGQAPGTKVRLPCKLCQGSGYR